MKKYQFVIERYLSKTDEKPVLLEFARVFCAIPERTRAYKRMLLSLNSDTDFLKVRKLR